MLIVLNVSELMRDIKKKSHREVEERIADVEARYRAEAGTEKEDEITRCMVEAASNLSHHLHRYLRTWYQDEVDDQLALPDAFVYDLSLSERRAEGKAQPLADYMHSFVVDLTLSRFYSSVSQQDLSNIHSQKALETARLLEDMLYTKKPPLL